MAWSLLLEGAGECCDERDEEEDAEVGARCCRLADEEDSDEDASLCVEPVERRDCASFWTGGVWALVALVAGAKLGSGFWYKSFALWFRLAFGRSCVCPEGWERD